MKRIHWILLATIIVLAASLRFYRIGKPNMWLDELWSIELASGRDSMHDLLPLGKIQHDPIHLTTLADAPPWWEIWTHLNRSAHPPIYHIILRWWMDVFGTTTGSARSLSALFSILSIVILFDICRMSQDVARGLLAALLMALAAGDLIIAEQVRSYSMLIFLALCCGDLVVRIRRGGINPRRILGLTILLVLTELTHYLGVGALAGLAVYSAIALRGKVRWATLGTFAAAALIAAAIWGPMFVQQQRTYDSVTDQYMSQTTDRFAILSLQTILLPDRFILGDHGLESMDTPAGHVMLWGIALTTMIVPIALALLGRRDLLFWVLWLGGAIGLTLGTDIVRESRLISITKYTILASPAIYALAVSYVWPRRPLLRHGIAFAVIAIAAIFGIPKAMEGFPDIGDMNAMAHLIDNNVPPNGLVVFFSGSYLASPGAWYMGWQYYSPNSRRDWMALMSPADSDVQRQLAPYDTLWLVGAAGSLPDQEILPGWKKVEEKSCSAGNIAELERVKPE